MFSYRGAQASQTVADSVQPNITYTLTVDAGTGTAPTAGYVVQLVATTGGGGGGTTILAESRAAAGPATGTWQQVTVEYLAPATPPAGALQIRLASADPNNTTYNSNRSYFDNVQLAATSATGDCDESTRLPGEDPASHCHLFVDPMGARNFPVNLPEQQSLTFGGFWSGGPYLGTDEPIPPLQGGLNPGAGYSYMWHSHTERELTNDDVFPGGMMTMFILEKEPEVCPGGLHPDNINDDGTFNTTPATCPVVP